MVRGAVHGALPQEEQNGLLESGPAYPPADLEYLCALVSGTIGSGLSHYRVAEQFDFLTPYEPESLEDMLTSVIVRRLRGESQHDVNVVKKYNSLKHLCEDWDIAVVF